MSASQLFKAANYQISGEPAIPQFEFPVCCLAKSFIVGYDDDSQPFLVELLEQSDDGFTGRAVKIAGGFVGQKQFGAVDQRSGDGHALHLAAGQFMRAMIAPMVEANLPKQLLKPLRIGSSGKKRR